MLFANRIPDNSSGGGGGEHGRTGRGGEVREAGEKRAESGSSKVAGTGRN